MKLNLKWKCFIASMFAVVLTTPTLCWGESLMRPTYRGRPSYEPAMDGNERSGYREEEQAGPYAPRGNQAWERHVTDRHQSHDQKRECNEDGCLYTNRERYRYERLDQYYIPHAQNLPAPPAKVASQPFYFLNRARRNCRTTQTLDGYR